MIIKINDSNGNNIAMCELAKDAYDNFLVINKENCENIFHDFKQSNTTGFTDIIDIDIKEIKL